MSTEHTFSDRRLANYKLIKKIGNGTFSQVYKCKDLKTDKIYAIKKIDYNKFNYEEKQNILREIRILASIDHPNIIGYEKTFVLKKHESEDGKEYLW